MKCAYLLIGQRSLFIFIVYINIAVNYFIWWIKLYIMSLLCYVLLPFVGFFYLCQHILCQIVWMNISMKCILCIPVFFLLCLLVVLVSWYSAFTECMWWRLFWLMQVGCFIFVLFVVNHFIIPTNMRASGIFLLLYINELLFKYIYVLVTNFYELC